MKYIEILCEIEFTPENIIPFAKETYMALIENKKKISPKGVKKICIKIIQIAEMTLNKTSDPFQIYHLKRVIEIFTMLSN